MTHRIENGKFIPDSATVLVAGANPDIQVPFRELRLENGEKLLLPTQQGRSDAASLPHVSEPFAPYVSAGNARRVKRTILERARAGEVTAHMEYAAIRESFGYDRDRSRMG